GSARARAACGVPRDCREGAGTARQAESEGVGRLNAPRAASAPVSQLSRLFRRARRFHLRHVDADARDGLAHLSPYRFGRTCRVAGSAFVLGLWTAALQLPMLVLSPIAGVLADRLDRRRLLIVVQLLAGAQALVLAALTFAGVVQVWHVIALSLFLGAMNAIETPTRQAFLLEMVETKADLPNAIALQSMLFNGARFVGPTIAGLLLALSGEALCFLLNGISYLGVVIAYLAIRVPARAPSTTAAPLWRELGSGFRYALGSLATRRLIVLLAALSLFSAPWMTLMPIFAGETFAGDSTTLGLLIGAVGVGALGATGFL